WPRTFRARSRAATSIGSVASSTRRARASMTATRSLCEGRATWAVRVRVVWIMGGSLSQGVGGLGLAMPGVEGARSAIDAGVIVAPLLGGHAAVLDHPGDEVVGLHLPSVLARELPREAIELGGKRERDDVLGDLVTVEDEPVAPVDGTGGVGAMLLLRGKEVA